MIFSTQDWSLFSIVPQHARQLQMHLPRGICQGRADQNHHDIDDDRDYDDADNDYNVDILHSWLYHQEYKTSNWRSCLWMCTATRSKEKWKYEQSWWCWKLKYGRINILNPGHSRGISMGSHFAEDWWGNVSFVNIMINFWDPRILALV